MSKESLEVVETDDTEEAQVLLLSGGSRGSFSLGNDARENVSS